MNTVTRPLVQRILSRMVPSRKRGGLLLILVALLLVGAGCAPRTAAGSWAGLALDTDGLVMSNIDRVTRLNASGTARWEFPAPGDRGNVQYYATPAITEDAIYVAGYDSLVHALDAANGQEIWNWTNSRSNAQIIAGPVVTAGKVIVGLGDRGIVALNQRNGEEVWFFDTEQGVWASPLVVDDVLYVSSLDKRLYALDVDSGEQLWQLELNGAIAGSPAYDAETGMLYVGTFGHNLYAIDSVTGTVSATFEGANWIWGGPALANGILYFGDMGGYLYAVTADTLSPVWQRQVAEDAIRATPLVLADRIVVGSRDKHVYAVDRENGSPIWNQTTGADVLGNMLQLDDGLIVVSTVSAEQQLLAYDLDGQMQWQYPAAVSEPAQ